MKWWLISTTEKQRGAEQPNMQEQEARPDERGSTVGTPERSAEDGDTKPPELPSAGARQAHKSDSSSSKSRR